MFKNVASQKLVVFAVIPSTGLPKTGDAANLTAYVSKDHGTLTALGDTSASEIDATNAKGMYRFDLAQAETNADNLLFTVKSSTSDVVIYPIPNIQTVAPNFGAHSIDSNGRVDVIKVAGTTQTAGDIMADTNDIQARLPAALVTGRMDVSVGAMAANVMTAAAANADLTTELQAGLPALIAAALSMRTATAQAGAAGTITLDASASAVDDFYNGASIMIVSGTGAGQFRIISDYVGSTKVASVASNWLTNPSSSSVFVIVPAGTSTGLDAAATRAALGLASANLDTQIGAVQSDTNDLQARLPAALTGDGNIKADTLRVGGTLQTAGDVIGDTNDIQARLPAALVSGRMDSSLGSVPAAILAQLRSVASGTADSGTTGTMVDAALTQADADYWKGMLIVFTSGNIAGQARVIDGFNASTDTVSFSPPTTQAVSTHTYEIWAVGDYLRPVTSGRKAGIASGGQIGVNWADVANQSTTVALSDTKVKANVTDLNGSPLDGDGSVGDPWGAP